MKQQTKRLGLAFDGGFSRLKVNAIDLTNKTSQTIHCDEIWRWMTRSVYAPTLFDMQNIVAVMDSGDGVSGIVGNDAMLLQPTLWQADATEAHYGSAAQKLFVRTAIMRACQEFYGNVHGMQIDVHLSLSVAGMHVQYIPAIKEAFSGSFKIFTSKGEMFDVRILTCEVQSQVFWLAIDTFSKWNQKTGTLLPFDASPIMGDHVPCFIDFGSMTFQGAAFARNLSTPPIKWCERMGTWEQVKDALKMRLQRKAMDAHIALHDPSTQELMTCYETGVLIRGKQRIDMADEIAEMVAPKVAQRISVCESQLHGGARISDMYLTGGDVRANVDAFKEFYQPRITGDVQIMCNEKGEEEPDGRVASGELKGAIRQYLMGLKK